MAERAIASAVLALAAALTIDARPAQAQAQGLTGETYHRLCHDRASAEWERAGQWICPAYLRGIIDGTRLLALRITGSVEAHQRVMPFCEPPDATAEAAVGLVVRFIEGRPESRSAPAVAVVEAALHEAWPCNPGR